LVGYALRRAQLAVFQDFVETMAALDIRPAQFSVLLLIELNPGVSQAQIGEALGIKAANLAVMLNALAARGVAERRPGALDRRAHALHLTAAGRALMRRLHDGVADHERRIVARLGASGKAQLLRLLAKLV
jgi:DNA-binding MarR family transcriptional regulator